MGRPGPGYIAVLLGCLALILAGFSIFWFQFYNGMSETGLSIPVAWGVYIANYVFWIAVGMSGTFISAMLFFFRVNWRSVINRTAETMTLFAVAIAGLFPLAHLGRVWVFWWVLPYPNWRHLWPNFKAPLVWDAIVIMTYLVVTAILWYVGLLPDLAAIRDRKPRGWRKAFYTYASLGWTGDYHQWRHQSRAYLAMAALAMPLAMGVHSITSWDYAMDLMPAWHSTWYAPYFISGAIHSGLATIILLLVPLRRVLHMENVFRPFYFQQMALLMVLTGWLLGYSYGMEAFMDWYSGSPFHRQLSAYRAYGTWYYSTMYWCVIAGNVVLPMTFLVRKWRANLTYLLVAAAIIDVSMFFERYTLTVVTLSHGYLPSMWNIYAPHAVEILITGLAIGIFVGGFLLMIKLVPAVSISELKKRIIAHQEVPPSG